MRGREVTRTFSAKAAAETWARTQEHAIETGEFVSDAAGSAIFADLVDDFVAGRTSAKRPPGKTFANGLKRLGGHRDLRKVTRYARINAETSANQ